jgi:hypothetical protein
MERRASGNRASTASSRLARTITAQGHDGGVTALLFSRDGTLKLWNLLSLRQGLT